MPCKIDFGDFQIRSLAANEKSQSWSRLIGSLAENGLRLATTGELCGPCSKWIRAYYPMDFCILAATEEDPTRPCLWNPVLNSTHRLYSGNVPNEATDVAVRSL